jgi:hypothetical protein
VFVIAIASINKLELFNANELESNVGQINWLKCGCLKNVCHNANNSEFVQDFNNFGLLDLIS